MRNKIRVFMEETFLFEFGGEITETCDLFKLGVLDSFGYIQLFKFLEREFKIKYTDDEILSNITVTFISILETAQKKADALSKTESLSDATDCVIPA